MTVRESLISLEQFGIKLGLDQIRGLLAGLDHPERAYPSIAVAGTNGKGSVTAMLERGLRAAGHRTGRYTSPHLVDLEERFAIGGTSILGGVLDHAAERVLHAARALAAPPSFFEATTALALDVFRDERVDVAILEVGLGGRLDATNAVDSIAAAITLVDFDHQQHLGDSLTEIATEKAGIIKPGSLVVVGENPPEVVAILSDQCRRVGAAVVPAAKTGPVTLVDGRAHFHLRTARSDHGPVALGLRGRHQAQNAMTAACLLEELDATGRMTVPASAIRTALEQTEWPGRLELRSWSGVPVLLDGAHNASGARALASYILETYGRPLPMVIGVMKDKDVSAILAPLTAAASAVVLTSASTPRAAGPESLKSALRHHAPDLPISIQAAPLDALRAAAGAGSPVVVAGSLYLVGEIRAHLS